ncbi:protein tramtrack, beta isoform [Ochlerotatus camptorhynchus]|uniref:protein tramtrack, beta isoform n=1 Tax=Ochlerotatus camptorhynchus TaxID=644619 RepID=UPI0031CE8266
MNRATISCVKWVDFSDHMFSTFLDVYANGLYTDVTLVPSDGGQLTACRMVLSMASKFFEDIFRTALTTMPASCVGAGAGPNDATKDVSVMIPDVSFTIMKHVLHFIYTGEVHMNAREMSDFFEACQLFGLKGLDYQNGNINGVKIAGSNIVTPEQYEYEELQDSYAEGSMIDVGGATESEEGAMVEPTVGADAVSEGEFQVEEVHKDGGTETETENQYYEMDMNMVDLESGTSNQESNDQTVMVTKEELVSGNQSNTSDAETSGESSGLCKKRLKNVEYGDKLDEAINTIIQGGASFRTASIQYGIPKTVLWRKAVKAPNYKADRFELPSPRKEAIEALKAGEKLLNISKRFDIPLSTLHRDKIKLFSEGALPDNVMLKQRDKGTDFKDRVLEAAQQCVAGLMSQSEASKLYRLPKTTIWRKIKVLRAADGGCSSQIDSSSTSVAADMSVDIKPELIEVLESQDDDGMEPEDQLEPDYVVMV